jgi:hypothetical protein
MASIPTNASPVAAQPAPQSSASLLIFLAPVPPESLEPTLSNLALAFPTQSVSVAIPDGTSAATQSTFNTLRLLPYAPPPSASSSLPILNAADFFSTWKLASENNASACLVLGLEAQSLDPTSIRALAASAATADLSLARYRMGPNEGLVNSAILYPLSRALYCARPRYPLAIDLGLSPRMAERLATTAQRYTAANNNDAFLWPVPEAVASGFDCTEVDVPARTFPQPPSGDLNSVLTQVAGSLFSDIESRAGIWQRLRGTVPPQPPSASSVAPIDSLPDTAPMLDSFRLAFTNLQEIWSLVLPPQSLLGLKHLSVMPAAEFRMPDSLWARIVYDFALAWRLRTLNRTHLLGALTPLYLAWVASHINLIRNGTPPERHIEEQAQIFETDKPYFVSRWRWPDRFNP